MNGKLGAQSQWLRRGALSSEYQILAIIGLGHWRNVTQMPTRQFWHISWCLRHILVCSVRHHPLTATADNHNIRSHNWPALLRESAANYDQETVDSNIVKYNEHNIS